MLKNSILIGLLCLTFLFSGCKKENKNVKKELTINTDMSIYEDALSSLKNPHYDMFYKLIAEDINAEINERTQIILPNDIKRVGSSFGNETIEVGATPIGLAAMYCNSKLVNKLLENGANPYAKINNVNPLIYILQCDENEQKNMLENYLKALTVYEKEHKDQFKNSDDLAINSKITTYHFKEGISLLNFAVYYNLLESTKLLLKYNVKLDMEENSSTSNPILQALRNRNIDIFNVLYNKYPNILYNKININNKSVLILDYIFYKGLDKEIRKSNSKNSIFFNAVLKPFPKDNESIVLIKKLISKDVNDVTVKEHVIGDYTFPEYTTALHISTYYGYRNLIKALTIRGIDVNSQDKLGNTALHTAILQGYPQITKLLLEAGVNPNIKNANGESALVAALKHVEDEKVRIELVKILTDSTSDLNEVYNDTLLLNKNTIEYGIISEKYKELRNNYITNILNYMSKNLEFIRLFNGGINNHSVLDADGFEVDGNNKKVYYPIGTTPLIYAVATCNEELLKHLILLGADIALGIKNENNKVVSAIDYANQNVNKCPNVLKMLQQPGNIDPNIDVKDYGYIYKEDENVHNAEIVVEEKKEEETIEDFYKNSPDIDVELILDPDSIEDLETGEEL